MLGADERRPRRMPHTPQGGARRQRRRWAVFIGLRKLSEKPQVVLEEKPDVVDAVLEHGDTLDPHAERPPRDLFRIVADVAQHLRMHHSGAEDLEPARLPADPTALAAAEEA